MPVWEDQQDTCPRCGGDKYESKDALAEGCFPLIVDTIARANPKAKDYDACIEKVIPILREAAEVVPASFDRFGQASLRALAGKGSKSKPGTCFVGFGRNSITFNLPNEGGKIHVVSIKGTPVVLSHPRIVDAAKYEYVVFGGIFAGFIYRSNGEPVPVIQDGFLIGMGGSSRYMKTLLKPSDKPTNR